MNKPGNSKLLGLLVVFILVIGIFVTVAASRQQTQTQQHASEFVNLNRAGTTGNINNSDQTMGPYTSAGNYSNTLPASSLGSLIFLVSDPNQGKPAFPTGLPTPSISTTKPVTGEAQTVKSLIIKIIKVEVHLAYLDSSKASDHWETLDMPLPMSVDLVQLAQGGVVSLGQTKLAAGKYTEIRLYIQSATVTLDNNISMNLNIPTQYNIVRVVQPFSISPGKNTTLVMDFDAQNSVVFDGQNYLLKPVVTRLLENK